MATTKRAEYKFTVKEFSDGTPWIMLEPMGKSIELPEDGFLGFDLPKGTDISRAGEIAKFMNANLSTLSLTSF